MCLMQQINNHADGLCSREKDGEGGALVPFIILSN